MVVLEEKRKEKEKREEKKTWFAIREVHHHRIVPYLLTHSPFPKASGNLGAKPLEITLHSGLLFLAAQGRPDNWYSSIVLLE